MDGWDGERWLDIAHFERFAHIMRARMDRAVTKGCDAIEPDNIGGYQNKTGFAISAQDQIRYNKWLAREAHARSLAIALKNDVDQISQLVHDFDFAINEECFAYDECDKLTPFIRAGKAVLHVEYEESRKHFCKKTRALGFASVQANWDLDGKKWKPCQ